MTADAPSPDAGDTLDHIGWVMAESRHAEKLIALHPDAPWQVLHADGPVDPARDAHVDALRLYAPGTEPLTRLFARVRQFGGLRRLSIGPNAGRELVAGIDQGGIPPSVTTLGVFTGGTPAAWPNAVVLPRVTTLRTDAPLRFTRGNFPNLRAVSLKPTASGTNLDAALSCPDLRELHLRTVPRDVFARIGHLPSGRPRPARRPDADPAQPAVADDDRTRRAPGAAGGGADPLPLVRASAPLFRAEVKARVGRAAKARAVP